jgi:thiol:disulfide interchange protein DsbC
MRLFTIILVAIAAFAPASYAESDLERMREVINKRYPNLTINHLTTTPVGGIYQLGIKNQVLYLSADGRYLFNGKLIDLDSGVDLSERYLSKSRLAALDDAPEELMIIYEPSKETKFTITTFTDIDCPYCRKMHQEIATLTSHGIRVRYMLYPRAGVGSPSYDKAVSVWCSEDRNEELTVAKRGIVPPKRECDNPVKDHMALARQLGLTGTPMTITDTGAQIMGYVPADEMLTRLSTARMSAASSTTN